MSVKSPFQLQAPYTPSGDQPQAIARLAERLSQGQEHQVLLGVTGSGKTFTLANLIANIGRPAIILAPNKTLAGQLYEEMRTFFPQNAVEYFVSYYDYYQPEAFVPATNTYIEKDSRINEQIEQLRLRATRSMMERPDTLIVATVSAIYGLGDPQNYQNMTLAFEVGGHQPQRQLLQHLVQMQYRRNDIGFERGQYRVRGDMIDVFPADQEDLAIRIGLLGHEIESLTPFDPLTGECFPSLQNYTLYPKTHYISPQDRMSGIMLAIQKDLEIEHQAMLNAGKLVEAQRLRTRVELDLEMIQEVGYCQGIENYARYLSDRTPGESPATLIDYLPKEALIILDESHVMVPQLRAMYAGDRSRKQTLVDHGFRLAAALDNRPLRFEEFEKLPQPKIYVSATPGPYESNKDDDPTQLIVRPTGLLDPCIEIRPQRHQVEDVYQEILARRKKNQRVLITTLTQKMSEHLSAFLAERSIKVRYLHAKVDTVERAEILRDLRLGHLEVVVGINLLREGLDLPEVSLVAIFDADKEGFLRSTSALIQTIGRAARHVEGLAILYADRITKSMQAALDEAQRRRERQEAFNLEHNITPRSVQRTIGEGLDGRIKAGPSAPETLRGEDFAKQYAQLEAKMKKAALELDFENAKHYRDAMHALKEQWLIS